MHKFLCIVLVSMGIAGPAIALPDDALPDTLRMNEIQVIGTHNSYHLRPDDDKLEAFRKFDPREAATWEYSHAPLFDQLEAGIRAFELDLNYYQGAWSVYHVPNLAENTSCREFVECLKGIQLWSQNNPTHVPVTVLLEIKEDSVGLPGKTEAITDEALRNMETVIRSVFPVESMVTPAIVQGEAPTMSEAIQNQGWPLLKDCRGKMVFLLLEKPGIQDQYKALFSEAKEALCFTFSMTPEDNQPDFAVSDAPMVEKIQPWVKAGFIVRTRADAGLMQGRNNDTTRREQAFASGAQIISTDFPPGAGEWRSFETGYRAVFADGNCVRVNPVLVPTE